MGGVKILKASAGSGKTYRLAYEYIKGVVLAPHLYRATLAVTFTNKATEQMKRRIIEGLDELARGNSPYMAELESDTGLQPAIIAANAATARTLILHDYSRFAVSTIDKFFQRVARAFFKELGLDFDYSVEIDNTHLLAEAVDRLLRRTADDAALREAVERVVNQQSERGRSWDIRPQLMSIGGELFKESYRPNPNDPSALSLCYDHATRELATRCEALKQTAREALELVDGAGLELTDFKGGSRSFALYFNKLWGAETPARYTETFRKAATDPEGWYTPKSASRDRIVAVLPRLLPLAQRVVDQVDALIVDLNTHSLVGDNFARSLLLSYMDTILKATAAERSVVMIHQTPALVEKLVCGNDAGFIYEKVGNAYDRYMIDEFQDTSAQQWNNFIPLLDDSLARTEAESVMLIGDVKQSIYRWRGGNWRILGSQAEAHFAGSLAPTVAMDTNWRSDRNIVDFNNRLIRSVVDLDTANLAEMLALQPELLPLAGMLAQSYESFEQKASPRKMAAPAEGFVSVTPVEADETLLRMVATVDDLLSRGYSQRDIVVLVRTARQGSQVADALLSAGRAIVSQEALLLGSSRVVEFVMATFMQAQYPEDPISRALWNNFRGYRYGREIDAAERQFLDSLLRLTPCEGFERIVQHYDLGRTPGDVSFLQAIYQAILSHAKNGVFDIPLMLEWWDESGRRKPIYLPSEQDAINIQTIHKAKGLEFKCVIIPYCDWKLLPASSAVRPTTLWAEASGGAFADMGALPINYRKEMGESHFADLYFAEGVYSHVDNINLLYVALTRAERELHILYDAKPFKTISRVSHLIDSVLPDMIGLERHEDGSFTYGTKGVARPSQGGGADERQILLGELPSVDAQRQLRISWASNRYFGQDDEPVSPRRHGVLMHRLFSLIENSAGIDRAVETMERTGEISPEDVPRVRSLAEGLLSDPMVRDWFDGEWSVRSECDIISSEGVRRPDRVMIRGDRAVVVDYKFGVLRNASHHRQVAEYLSIMGRMDYSDVEGYLWYVEAGEVEKVQPY